MCVQQDNAAALVPDAATAAETPPASQKDEHAQFKVCRQCESVSLIVPHADCQPCTDKQLCRSSAAVPAVNGQVVQQYMLTTDRVHASRHHPRHKSLHHRQSQLYLIHLRWRRRYRSRLQSMCVSRRRKTILMSIPVISTLCRGAACLP
jgi:hypothetical protein